MREGITERLVLETQSTAIGCETPDGGFTIGLSCSGREYDGKFYGVCLASALKKLGYNLPEGEHPCLKSDQIKHT